MSIKDDLTNLIGEVDLVQEISDFVETAKKDTEKHILKVADMIEESTKELAKGAIKLDEFKRDVNLATDYGNIHKQRLEAEAKSRMEILVKKIIDIVIGKLFELLKEKLK